jgi:hypothetical protein
MLYLGSGPVSSPYSFRLIGGMQHSLESFAYVRGDSISGELLNLDHGFRSGIAEGEICALMTPIGL